MTFTFSTPIITYMANTTLLYWNHYRHISKPLLLNTQVISNYHSLCQKALVFKYLREKIMKETRYKELLASVKQGVILCKDVQYFGRIIQIVPNNKGNIIFKVKENYGCKKRPYVEKAMCSKSYSYTQEFGFILQKAKQIGLQSVHVYSFKI